MPLYFGIIQWTISPQNLLRGCMNIMNDMLLWEMIAETVIFSCLMLPNFHCSKVASLQWPKAEELQWQQKKKQTTHKLSVQKSMQNWRVKSPAKPIMKISIWILISVVGSWLLDQPYEGQPPQKHSKQVKLSYNSSFTLAFLRTGNKLSHSFLALSFF